MTDGNSGKIANWVVSIVAILSLFLGGAVAYSNLNSKSQEALTRITALEKEVASLDYYDVKLSEDVDDLNDRMIRSESEQASIRRTQGRIEQTMNEMLKELKGMREDIIKMGVRNGITQ